MALESYAKIMLMQQSVPPHPEQAGLMIHVYLSILPSPAMTSLTEALSLVEEPSLDKEMPSKGYNHN